MPRWSIFTEERRKDTIKRAQMQKNSLIIPTLSNPPSQGRGRGWAFLQAITGLQDYTPFYAPLFRNHSFFTYILLYIINYIYK